MSDPTVVFVAGIGNSDPDHWQRRWHDRLTGSVWVEHRSWDHPVRDEWVRDLEATIHGIDGPALLVAHSLGCTLVLQWAAEHVGDGVVGVLLVAPPDVHGPAFPGRAVGFDQRVPPRLPFRTVVVVADDDPYGTPEHAAGIAAAVGGDLVQVGSKGHINAASRLGDWSEGWAVLDELRSAARPRSRSPR